MVPSADGPFISVRSALHDARVRRASHWGLRVCRVGEARVDRRGPLADRRSSARPCTPPGLKNAAAFAFDTEGRLWVATADYSDAGKDARVPRREAGRHAGGGHLRAAHPARAALVPRRALRRDRPGASTRSATSHGTTFATRRTDPDAPGEGRREQQHRARARRAHAHGHLRAVRPLHAEVEVLGRDRLVPSRRQRSARVRERHPRAGRARVLPGHERPASSR